MDLRLTPLNSPNGEYILKLISIQIQKKDYLLGHRRSERHYLRSRRTQGQCTDRYIGPVDPTTRIWWRRLANSHLGHGSKKKREPPVARKWRLWVLQEALFLELQSHVGHQKCRKAPTPLSEMWCSYLWYVLNCT